MKKRETRIKQNDLSFNRCLMLSCEGLFFLLFTGWSCSTFSVPPGRALAIPAASTTCFTLVLHSLLLRRVVFNVFHLKIRPLARGTGSAALPLHCQWFEGVSECLWIRCSLELSRCGTENEDRLCGSVQCVVTYTPPGLEMGLFILGKVLLLLFPLGSG